MTNESKREMVAAVGVIVGLVFVGLQVRQSNVQAKAAAYQAIGIQTSQYFLNRDARVNRLYTLSANLGETRNE